MKLLSTIFGASLAIAIFAEARAADLLLRERVVPAGSVIRLGEVAEVLRAAPDEAARLERLPLMPAPAPGTLQVIRGQEIRDLLVAHDIDLADLRFGGSTRVTIGSALPATPAAESVVQQPSEPPQPEPKASPRPRRQSGYRLVTESPTRRRRRSTVSLSRADVASAKDNLLVTLQQYVEAQTNDQFIRVRDLDLLTRSANLLARATSPVKITKTEPIDMGRQRFLIAFESEIGGVNFPVFADLQRATPVVVATAPIARGSVITAANIKVVPQLRSDNLATNETPLVSIEEALGKESGRALRVGQTLTDANCLPPTLVQRGEVVDVVTGGGGIRVRMKAKARSDGRLGDTIQVEGLTDRERLEARVVGHRELAVLSADSNAASYLSSAPRSRRIR